MTADVQAGPEVLEAGRYRLFRAPDGAWVVARAVETCETCQACDCGTQADPIVVPAMVVKMASNRGMMAKFRAVTGFGSGSDDGGPDAA
jgi:hypothetical protein